ncbi:membrane protein [Cellvibrio zantedeschiae]|uniref:Membrane protein n=1 Tax=Cellvibrio zantedeschiae TaxID=1237077 RepID=A0ABQ3AQY2_9GAMM|nr:phosphatase PAP2 family protein [Cellvibrio zantedeschiae]GGY64026.1 membrane protein [Cellvibrio zantedeschiae]
MITQDSRLFWRNHLIIPLTIFIALTTSIGLSDLNIKLADALYAWEGGHWALKNAWVTRALIHETGKHISLSIALLSLIALITTYIKPQLVKYQRELLYLVCAAAGSSGLITVLKGISHVSCPWDFIRYGGDLPYQTILTQIIHTSGSGCFPAGHASGGYAWLAFYFLGVHRNSSWRWAGLAFALGVGLVFGISQQLRGAHFISHDVWTLGICWFFSLFMYKLMLLDKVSVR